jgi:hypothetical protein
MDWLGTASFNNILILLLLGIFASKRVGLIELPITLRSFDELSVCSPST